MSGQQAEKQTQAETAPRMSGNTISSNLARTESIKNEIALTADARQSSFGAETIINEEEPTDEERRTLRRSM